MTRPVVELLPGTLDLLVLKTLAWGPTHGLGVLRSIENVTHGELLIEEGALYPALHRLEERGWVAAEWRVTEHRRRAKFYTLTPRGRQQLGAETDTWLQFVDAVACVLRATQQPA